MLDCGVILELWSWWGRQEVCRESAQWPLTCGGFEPSGCTELIKVLCLKWSAVACVDCVILWYTNSSCLHTHTLDILIHPWIQMMGGGGDFRILLIFTFTTFWFYNQVEKNSQKLNECPATSETEILCGLLTCKMSHWHHRWLITAVFTRQTCKKTKFALLSGIHG